MNLLKALLATAVAFTGIVIYGSLDTSHWLSFAIGWTTAWIATSIIHSSIGRTTPRRKPELNFQVGGHWHFEYNEDEVIADWHDADGSCPNPAA